jgi:hypothetical protein
MSMKVARRMMLHVESRQRMVLGLTPDAWRAIGYVRDALVILVITVGGMYLLDHPEKFDALLNWMLYRQSPSA